MSTAPPTVVEIEGGDFLINGAPTYAGRFHQGRRIEGLLMNSRMIQAIFDDENPETAAEWRYPETKRWDAARNTQEFCETVPLYRKAGLLAVTVGLQGGGPIYTPTVYDRYVCSAFETNGALKAPFFDRLKHVLETCEGCGVAVIVNYFYWRQERFESDRAILRAAREATEWLLASGHRNVLVDVKNEIREGEGLLASRGIHRVLDLVRHTTLGGRRLPVSTSTFPTNHFPAGSWPAYCDFLLPHTNDSKPEQIRAEMREIRKAERERGTPRPIMVNEDGPDLASLEAAVDEGVSWGYFDQGYGCDYTHAKRDWRKGAREDRFEDLSGYQTPPVNWGINTPEKRAFFSRVAEITGQTWP